MYWLAFVVILFQAATPAYSQAARTPANPPEVGGVYQAIPSDVTLPAGRKNDGSPAAIALLPAAQETMKAINPKDDPARKCKPVGPFRMMARDRAKIELVAAPGIIMMLFEDISHGLVRTIHTNRAHPEKLEPTWLGDSIGRWESDVLVVDTVGFNDNTWLNERGAQHSDALHLVERIRPILSGKYLEYKVTAEDSKALARPYTYTRYYEKLNTRVTDDVCEDEE